MFLKPAPVPEGPAPEPAPPRSVEELEEAVRIADDKERLIGLLAAPFAAGIGMLVVSALISHDPATRLKSGRLNPLHVSVSLYHDLLLVLVGLAVLMLAFAWFRKRLYLGMVTALYGLAIFNLHYWGFGVPYILVAAWLLVRAYRLQRDLKAAKGITPRWSAASSSPATGTGGRPTASRRYTPPAPKRKRPGVAKPEV